MMQLHIKNLRFPAVIGIHRWEKERTRLFNMQITIRYDAHQAIVTDDFGHALDYKKLENAALEFTGSQEWNLIETLAGRCAEHLFNTFPQIQEIELGIEKPQAMDFAESVTASAFLRRSSL